jgi:hypothetical protein
MDNSGGLKLAAVLLKEPVSLTGKLLQHSTPTAHLSLVQLTISRSEHVVVHRVEGPLEQFQSALTDTDEFIDVEQFGCNRGLV